MKKLLLTAIIVCLFLISASTAWSIVGILKESDAVGDAILKESDAVGNTIIKEIGSLTVLGANDIFKYSLISIGSNLQVPEGATGCDIHDDSIRGTLDLDETVTVKNTWVTTVDLAGIGAAETATFNNCAFLQSQATIEATLGVDGAVNFTNCLFGIATTNFRDYAGADFHLMRVSALKDVGYATGADIDIEGRATPLGAGYDIGAYEFRRSGDSMSMSMGLRGGFAPYRWED